MEVFNKELIEKVDTLRRNGTIRRDIEIAEKTGFSKGVVSNYLNGRVKASRNFLEKFSEVFKVSNLETNGNGLNKRGKPYLSEIDAFAGKTDIATQDMQEFITGYIYIPEFTKADVYINVRGSSMFPRYVPGEIICLKRVNDMTEIQYGQVYVIVTEENRMLKYVRKGKDKDHLTLLSENKNFDDIEVERKKVKALFLVLGKISKDVL